MSEYKIYSMNYANDKYRNSQRLNTWSAYQKGKVDKVFEFTPNDLDSDFIEKNREILGMPRGNGYWLWKPYLILKAFMMINDGDYLIYCDSGAVFVRDVHYLIDFMVKQGLNVLCFSLDNENLESFFSKRDAFIRMECDEDIYSKTPMRLATYMVFRKSAFSRSVVEKWLSYAEDKYILTDCPNIMGFDNFEGFKDNRHDQTVWSLLTKKMNIPAFRDPSQFGKNKNLYDATLLKNSNYPQIFYSHRNGNIKNWSQLQFYVIKKKIIGKNIFLMKVDDFLNKRVCGKIKRLWKKKQ